MMRNRKRDSKRKRNRKRDRKRNRKRDRKRKRKRNRKRKRKNPATKDENGLPLKYKFVTTKKDDIFDKPSYN